jgi:hypothetical protein
MRVPGEGYSSHVSIMRVPDEGYSSHVSIMRVPDEGYSRNASCALSLIYSFYYKHVLHTVRFQHRIVFLAWKLMMTYEWNQNNHTSRMTSIFQL